MANNFSRCGLCKGNLWPDGHLKDHMHLPDLTVLKRKYRVAKSGWNRPASPRTNSPIGKINTIKPRRHAYGPF